jgi:hypothetical protein
MRRLLVLSLLALPACGDDTSNATGGTGGTGGTAGSAGHDANIPDASGDAFVRGDGGYPDNVGAPCGSDTECGTNGQCLQPDFFCSTGFCTKRNCTATTCPTGTVCATLPILSQSGQPTALTHCFLPCNTQNDCGDPGRLYCDTQRHICSVGQYLENVGSLGAHQTNGSVCVGGTPPDPTTSRTLFQANVQASDPQLNFPSEPHIAVDPSDPNKIYVAYNSSGSTVSVSSDGGQTWTHHAIDTIDAADAGDPVLAVDPTNHDVWHVYLTGPSTQCTATMPYPGNNRIHAARSTDGGQTWTVMTANDPTYNSASYFLDKPWLHIANDGTIYVTYTPFTTDAAVTNDIALSASTDHGATWHHKIINDQTPDRAHGRQLTGMDSDSSGKLYIVWNEDSGNSDDPGGYVWIASTADRGSTISANVRVNPAPEALFDDPQVAVAPNGTIFVVYGAAVVGGQADAEDVKATFSTDGGSTWAPPVKINDDPSCASHWHPAAVADASNRLWMIWYDERYGDGRVAWAKATVAGNTLQVASQDRGWVTDAAQSFTTSRVRFFLGDYIGLAISNNQLFAAWGDLRTATSGRVAMFFSKTGTLP